MVEWERVQRTMEILKWLGGAAGSLAQNVSVGTPTVSVGLPTCVLVSWHMRLTANSGKVGKNQLISTFPVSRFCRCRIGLPSCEAEICIASKMKLGGVLGVWG